MILSRGCQILYDYRIPVRCTLVLISVAGSLLCVGHARPRGNCGISIPLAPGAPSEAYDTITLHGEVVDLEDDLFRGPNGKEYDELVKSCRNGDGQNCRTFGITQWNLTYFGAFAASHHRVRSKPHADDIAAWPRASNCNYRKDIICQMIEGQTRIVGVSGVLNRRNLEAWKRLPHLFGIQVVGYADEDFSDLSLPASLRLVQTTSDSKGWKQLSALMRAQGAVRSVLVAGQQDKREWDPFDLGQLCGLDLVRFSGFVLNIVGSTIPECWSKMRNLEAFYCSNCMMSLPPTALRGLQSLRSFIAFRQSEMVPCALRALPADKAQHCRASWETRHGTKGDGVRESTGHWGDFQEGPSFLCPDHAYGFPFEELLDLGWTNVQKVWLDGNFIIGGIPDRIAEVWPNLISLDLYDNHMEGPIPESLGRLDMVKLQLQSNKFNGTLPEKVVKLVMSERKVVLGISGNPQLSGCIPSEAPLPAETKLERCGNEEL